MNRKIVNKELDTDRGRYQFKVNNSLSYRIQNFPNILLLFTAKSHTLSLARLLENHLKYVTIKRRTTLTSGLHILKRLTYIHLNTECNSSAPINVSFKQEKKGAIKVTLHFPIINSNLKKL